MSAQSNAHNQMRCVQEDRKITSKDPGKVNYYNQLLQVINEGCGFLCSLFTIIITRFVGNPEFVQLHIADVLVICSLMIIILTRKFRIP